MIALLFLEVRIYHLPIMHYLFDDIYANILNSLVNFSILKENIFLHDNQHIDYKVLDDHYKGCLSIFFLKFIFYFNEFLIFFGFYLITNIPKGHIEEIFALGSIFSKANNKYSITCVLSDKTCFNLNISQSWKVKVKSLVYTCK